MAVQMKIGTAAYEVVRFTTRVIRSRRNGIPAGDAGCTGLQVTVVPAADDLTLYDWYASHTVCTGTIRLKLAKSTRTVTFTKATLGGIADVYDASAPDQRRLQLTLTIVPKTVTVADRIFDTASAALADQDL